MLSFVVYALSLILSCAVLLYLRISRGISYTGGIGRIGSPGVLGYIATALRYTFDAESVVIEGRRLFSGKPFAIPTLAGPVFLLPPEYLEVVRSSNDDVFNQPTAVNEDLQLPFTMDHHQMHTPYQAAVLRTDVNRALPSMISYMLEESNVAMEETFISESASHSVTLPVFDAMTHLIARVSNRVIFGLELCRNKEFLHAIVRFSETVTVIAPFVRWSPAFCRRFVYFMLSSILGGKQEPLRHIVAYLQRHRFDEKESMSYDDEPLVARFMSRASQPYEPLEGIAMRLMNINFGSIHTSSIFITQALFELSLLTKLELDCIREEILRALEVEGGWTKVALLNFKKLDSVLREVGRYYGLMHFALPRIAMQGQDLHDGTRIPPGFRVAIDMKAVHFNSEVYPDPGRCDLFRFSKLRQSDEGSTSKYGFATPDSNYLPFGAGKHACAGRFFAAMELKIMLAHILLNYDVSYPPGITSRPVNTVFNGAIIPDTKAQLVFTRRSINDDNGLRIQGSTSS